MNRKFSKKIQKWLVKNEKNLKFINSCTKINIQGVICRIIII